MVSAADTGFTMLEAKSKVRGKDSQCHSVCQVIRTRGSRESREVKHRQREQVFAFPACHCARPIMEGREDLENPGGSSRLAPFDLGSERPSKSSKPGSTITGPANTQPQALPSRDSGCYRSMIISGAFALSSPHWEESKVGPSFLHCRVLSTLNCGSS